MKHNFAGLRSFTLVEILVVVSIIGLLAGLAIPAVGGALASARKAKVSAMGVFRFLAYRDWETDRKSTRLNSSHLKLSRMPSSA